MQVVKTIRELVLIQILIIMVGMALVALFAPVTFGQWLQKIDTGRFEMIDCDCTDAFE